MQTPSSPPPPSPSPAAEADREARRQLGRVSRRGFAIAGGALAATWAGLIGLARSGDDAGIPWPLRRVLELNERLWRAGFRKDARAPEFPRDRAREPRVNGGYGLIGANGGPGIDPATWRLRVTAPGVDRAFSTAALAALPRAEQTTELKCIEGWSEVVHWSGVRLADVARVAGVDIEAPPPFVGLTSVDGGYYVGLDVESALHPQTLLADALNGAPLSPGHGAPLRLVIPLKYGIKHIKQIGTMAFTDRRPADFWAERGYDWYAGL